MDEVTRGGEARMKPGLQHVTVGMLTALVLVGLALGTKRLAGPVTVISTRVQAANETSARREERNVSSATVKLLLPSSSDPRATTTSPPSKAPSNRTAKTSDPDHVLFFQKIHAAFEGLQDNEETDSCETAEPGMRR